MNFHMGLQLIMFYCLPLITCHFNSCEINCGKKKTSKERVSLNCKPNEDMVELGLNLLTNSNPH